MGFYQSFERFSLDPKNEREVLDLAVTRAYQASGGELNTFNAGSPLMVMLEALTFSHMEFLHWANQLPEVMVLSFVAEALGAKRNLGSASTASVQVTLTTDLKTDFFLNSGTIIYSNKNSAKYYSLTETLIIPAGQLIGFVSVQAYRAGEEMAVVANELTILQENFAYVQSVTNPAASTIGSSFETLEEVRQRVQTLMSQRTPVSLTDWKNLIELTFPGKYSLVRIEDSVLTLYIQNYTTNSVFENFVASVKAGLQKVIIRQYFRTDVDIIIKSDIDFSVQQSLDIAEKISNFLTSNIEKKIQPIDIYQDFANNFLNSDDITGFEVYYYPNSINPAILNLPTYSAFDFVGGQLVRDSNGNYYTTNSNFNVVNGANDEAAIGNLKFHPIYQGNGEYSADDIVQIGTDYYLVNSSGAVQIGTTTNYTLLSAPLTWAPGTSYSPTDFILEESINPNIKFGYTPNFSYTSEANLSTHFTPVLPVLRAIGDTVNVQEYLYILGQENVIYYNSTGAPLVITAVNLQTYLADVKIYPEAAFSHLSRVSKYRVGQITADKNYIYIDSNGNKSTIPTGVVVSGNTESQTQFGSLIEDSGIVYEVAESFIPVATDTIATLLANGFIRRAYRKYEDFETLNYTGFIPSYFDIHEIKFIQPTTKTITKTGAAYSIV